MNLLFVRLSVALRVPLGVAERGGDREKDPGSQGGVIPSLVQHRSMLTAMMKPLECLPLVLVAGEEPRW